MLGEARISTGAISANAAILITGDRDRVADLSFDAYGHGVLQAASAARAGGIVRFSATNDQELTALRGAGFQAERAVGASSLAGDLFGFGEDCGFVPAMTVASPVLGTKLVEAGDGVSYGYTFRAVTRSTLALVGIGYADGVDRIASNRGTVVLGGTSRPIVGRVAMNALMVDLGDESCEVGDEVTVIGVERRAAEWAAEIGRLVPEVVIGFGSRLVRVWT